MSAFIVSRYTFGAGHLSPSLWKVETQYKSNGNVCHPNRWFFSSPPFIFCLHENSPRVIGPWIHHHVFTKGFSYPEKKHNPEEWKCFAFKGVLLAGELMAMFWEGGCRGRQVRGFIVMTFKIITFLWVKRVSSLFQLCYFEIIQTPVINMPPLICWLGAF